MENKQDNLIQSIRGRVGVVVSAGLALYFATTGQPADPGAAAEITQYLDKIFIGIAGVLAIVSKIRSMIRNRQ